MFSVKQACSITLICTLGGIIFYGFYDEKIHIDYSIRHEGAPVSSEPSKPLTLFYSKNNSLSSINITSFINTLDNETLKNVVNVWLSHLFEYHPKLQKTICHSLIAKNSLYYCSLTINPFTPTTPMYEKYTFFEGLLQTLFTLDASLKGVVFLINHQAFEDDDYDFSLPWTAQIYK